MPIPHKTRQDAEDQRHRAKVNAQILKDIQQLGIRFRAEGKQRVLDISDAEWQAAVDADREREKADDWLTIEADVSEARPKPWEATLAAGSSDVMNLAFDARAEGEPEVLRLQAELTGQRGKAYADELGVQARRAGCDQYRPVMRHGPEWVALGQESGRDAESITRTFNNEMARQVAKIRQEVPTANRYVYAKRLGDWADKRAIHKEKQVSQ